MTGRRYLPAALAVFLFFLLRVLLLIARDPFFDELFTLWMVRQPFGRIIPNLLHDSGPPLYYFLARFDSLLVLRLMSLAFATAQFALVIRRSVLAALLLAVYPPAVLLAIDARSYALCALFVTIGVLAIADGRRMVAAIALVVGAYAHYYGVLFFPLLLTGVRRPELPAVRSFADLRRFVQPFVVAVVLFVPALILALHQPRDATRWIGEALYAPLTNVSMGGFYPYWVFRAPPAGLIVIALVVLVIAVARSWDYAPAVVLPILFAIAFHLAGRAIYFPLRFESVIAAPLMLWCASSLARYPVPWRQAIAGALLLTGLVTVYIGILDHITRPLDPRQLAVIELAKIVRPNEPIVASGLCYLVATMRLDRPVEAWPPEQAAHPGWRTYSRPDPRTLPRGEFIWIGEMVAPDLQILQEARPLRPLFISDRVLIARAAPLTLPVH